MNFRQEMHDRVYAAFCKQYGICSTLEKKRLEGEMEQFDGQGWHEGFLLMQVLAAKCRSEGHYYSTSLDGSFAAYLLHMARYNPLPQSMNCPSGHMEYCNIPDKDSALLGPDMEDKKCNMCGVEMKGDGFDLQMNWNPKRPLWIRTTDEAIDTMRKTLWRFADGDVMDSETLRGISYVLHPGEKGGRVVNILATTIYSLLDKARSRLGPADPPDHASIWEGGLYKGYVPGFLNETEQYMVRKSGVKNWSELTYFLMRMRETSKTRALYLAADYLAAVSYVKRFPAEWFAAYLSSNAQLFDYVRMGKGKEKCSWERSRNWEQMFFTDLIIKSHARMRNDIYRACEAAYDCGITFLPPDPLNSHKEEFIVLPDRVLLPPLQPYPKNAPW